MKKYTIDPFTFFKQNKNTKNLETTESTIEKIISPHANRSEHTVAPQIPEKRTPLKIQIPQKVEILGQVDTPLEKYTITTELKQF